MKLLLATALLVPQLAWAAPSRLHLIAHYTDGKGKPHTLELWRDGDHLRRDTDERLSLYVEHHPRGDDRYRVVDRARGVAYSVGRNNLYRIGTFVDWTSLTTLLTPAPAKDPLAPTAEDATTPLGHCRWKQSSSRRVCWSTRWSLPLLLAQRDGDGWKTVLTVDELRVEPIPAATFAPPAKLAEIDVDRDLGHED